MISTLLCFFGGPSFTSPTPHFHHSLNLADENAAANPIHVKERLGRKAGCVAFFVQVFVCLASRNVGRHMQHETVTNSTLFFCTDHVNTRIQREIVQVLGAVERLGEPIHSKLLASKGSLPLHEVVDKRTDVPLLNACTEILTFARAVLDEAFNHSWRHQLFVSGYYARQPHRAEETRVVVE